MEEDSEQDEENELEFPYDSKKEYYETLDFATTYWMEIHIRKWGKQILNDTKYKDTIIEKTSAYDDEYYDDDFEITPWVSSDATELIRQYINLRTERIVKNAFLISACDGRRTLRKRDLLKSILMIDLEKTAKECMCGKVHLKDGEIVKFE